MSEEAGEETSNSSEERSSSELFITNPLQFVGKFAEKWNSEIGDSLQKELKEILEENDHNSVQPFANLLENSLFLLALLALFKKISTSGIHELQCETMQETKKMIKAETMRVMNRMAASNP